MAVSHEPKQQLQQQDRTEQLLRRRQVAAVAAKAETNRQLQLSKGNGGEKEHDSQGVAMWEQADCQENGQNGDMLARHIDAPVH
jgi:hypothetical protein